MKSLDRGKLRKKKKTSLLVYFIESGSSAILVVNSVLIPDFFWVNRSLPFHSKNKINRLNLISLQSAIKLNYFLDFKMISPPAKSSELTLILILPALFVVLITTKARPFQALRELLVYGSVSFRFALSTPTIVPGPSITKCNLFSALGWNKPLLSVSSTVTKARSCPLAVIIFRSENTFIALVFPAVLKILVSTSLPPCTPTTLNSPVA